MSEWARGVRRWHCEAHITTVVFIGMFDQFHFIQGQNMRFKFGIEKGE